MRLIKSMNNWRTYNKDRVLRKSVNPKKRKTQLFNSNLDVHIIAKVYNKLAVSYYSVVTTTHRTLPNAPPSHVRSVVASAITSSF